MSNDLDLRSKAIRKLLDQKPSIAVRFGTMVLFFSLLFLTVLVYYFPYEQRSTGYMTIVSKKKLYGADSMVVVVSMFIEDMHFGHKTHLTICVNEQGGQKPKGVLLRISPDADAYGRRQGICVFRKDDVERLIRKKKDVHITCSYRNLLSFISLRE